MAGLIDNETNAMVMGFFVGLILGLLENPLVEFWWGSYVALAYDYLFGGQILLLVILAIIFAYVSNAYFKLNIQSFVDSHASWLTNWIK
jgi:hypothetical protein